MSRFLKVFTLLFFTVPFTLNAQNKSLPDDNGLIQALNATLSDALIHDGFPPPLASRIYAYCHVAGYESVYYTDPSLKTLSGQLNGLHLNEPGGDTLSKLNSNVVLAVAFCKVATEFTWRDYILDNFRDSILNIYKAVLDTGVYARSLDYGESIHKQIMKWVSKDGYKETRNMPKYRPQGHPGSWRPTLPTLGDALEPWWPMLRPFVLDSSGLFSVQNPPPFSTDVNSDYYKQAMDVMQKCTHASDEQMQISLFWDDNPQKTVFNGHLMYNIRQLSPAGHWMSITGLACSMKHLSVPKTEEVCALVSMAMCDGFIDTWHEKYKTDRMRPETYINLYIDKVWQPMIETPMFPENPSAHATISNAAAEILTDKFGADFAFIDSSEVPFDKGVRSFNNFKEAAVQAGMSRFYAGIHYEFGCTEGINLGQKIGRYVLTRVKTRI